MPYFEWDRRKNAANKKNHRVSFEVATLIFNDPNLVSYLDTRFDYGEERWISVGSICGSGVLIVAHTLREEHNGEEIIRIISARKATRREEERYLSSNA